MIKNSIFTAIVIFFFYCIIELFSYFVLNNITTIQEKEWGKAEQLTKKFPAQLRMSKSELFAEFSDLSLIQRTGQFLSFEFDPLLGYRKLDFQRWYGGDKSDIHDKFVIVCFGGSTTQLDNWPKYLNKYAQQAGVTEDILVLNAGVAGYNTISEMLYFSRWILPWFTKQNKKPDLILTLDGVNDIWYRIFSYLFVQRKNIPIWYTDYHGSHQKHDFDMQNMRNLSSSFKQFAANLLHETRYIAIRIAPYSMRLLEYGARFFMRKKANSSKVVIPPTENLPIEIEQQIVESYQNSLTDFFAIANQRNIDFVAYLQPVVLPKYYPHPIPDNYPFKGIDHMGAKEYSSIGGITDLVSNRTISTASMYEQIKD